MENTHLYPPDWPVVRQEVIDRAGNHCEFCKAPNRTEVWRMLDPGLAGHWMGADRQLHDASGNEIAHRPELGELNCTPSYIVLSVCHLDHNTLNTDRGNMKALCQRCKLRYEAQRKADAVRATRRRHRNERQGDLLEGL